MFRRIWQLHILLCCMMLTGGVRGAQNPAAPPVAYAASDIALEIAGEARGKIKDFYATRNFQPLWLSRNAAAPHTAILLDYLETADRDGLKPRDYKIDKLRAALDAAASGDAKQRAKADVLLTKRFVDYVEDLRAPKYFKKIYPESRFKPKKLKTQGVLGAASLVQDFPSYVAAMGWMSPHYLRVRKALGEAGTDPAKYALLQRNLARARVLPGPWTHHVVVDTASARLWFYQAGRAVGTMRVVVGKPQSPTPMLAGMLQYAILNPYWNVPVDLAQHNIAPKIIGGATLQELGFEALSDWSATPRKLAADEINWTAIASGQTEIRLRQLPGGSNAMGRVKFLFDNDHGIYLHDTPERELLAKPDRHFSNGCIRLADADALGTWLLGQRLAASGKTPEQIIALPLPVPIYLTYLPEDAAGDVYGWDGQGRVISGR